MGSHRKIKHRTKLRSVVPKKIDHRLKYPYQNGNMKYHTKYFDVSTYRNIDYLRERSTILSKCRMSCRDIEYLTVAKCRISYQNVDYWISMPKHHLENIEHHIKISNVLSKYRILYQNVECRSISNPNPEYQRSHWNIEIPYWWTIERLLSHRRIDYRVTTLHYRIKNIKVWFKLPTIASYQRLVRNIEHWISFPNMKHRIEISQGIPKHTETHSPTERLHTKKGKKTVKKRIPMHKKKKGINQ